MIKKESLYFVAAVLVVFMLLRWAGCTQQEKPKVTYNSDGSISIDRLEPGQSVEVSVVVPMPEIPTVNEVWKRPTPKFDPTKHYIISVDTVPGGWYGIPGRWPTLDTTWADKEHLLVTPEEKKKILAPFSEAE